ncbi:hypothetical protein BS78_05G164000 [Paspalum vaginatum]|nr:hypothetical protein BS78_05G164000 [Paspalum vaginatum]
MSTLEETCDGVHIGFFSATAAPPAPKRCCGCSAPATVHTKAIVPPMDHMNQPAILVDRPQDSVQQRS